MTVACQICRELLTVGRARLSCSHSGTAEPCFLCAPQIAAEKAQVYQALSFSVTVHMLERHAEVAKLVELATHLCGAAIAMRHVAGAAPDFDSLRASKTSEATAMLLLPALQPAGLQNTDAGPGAL